MIYRSLPVFAGIRLLLAFIVVITQVVSCDKDEENTSPPILELKTGEEFTTNGAYLNLNYS